MSLLNLFISAGKGVSEWRRRRQAYTQLMALDEHSLADIGIRRSEIRALCEGDYAAGTSAKLVRSQRQKTLARKAA
jgi:uncharacterized protein YjiS (DUF1127 family)